jgi:hypothetical protein
VRKLSNWLIQLSDHLLTMASCAKEAGMFNNDTVMYRFYIRGITDDLSF